MTNLTYLITGIHGQLGNSFVAYCNKHQLSYIGCDRKTLALEHSDRIEETLLGLNFDVLIHCAAYTNVAQAEKEPLKAEQINAQAVLKLAQFCTKHHKKLVYFSTDYVFDGCLKRPYETDDVPQPLNVYGRSKYQGEQFVLQHHPQGLIVRTSWVIGLTQTSFLDKIQQLAQTQSQLSIVSDQIGSPSFVFDIVPCVFELLHKKASGIVHVSNESACSWYDLVIALDRLKPLGIPIVAVKSCEFKSDVVRPLYSYLSKKSLDVYGVKRLPHWQDSLKEWLKKSKK